MARMYESHKYHMELKAPRICAIRKLVPFATKKPELDGPQGVGVGHGSEYQALLLSLSLV